MSDIWNNPDVKAWVARTAKELPGKIDSSAIVISIVPETAMKTDVKFAVELGFSIMMDKPIIAVVRPGTRVPDRLVRVADAIVECNMESETDREKLAATINRLHLELFPEDYDAPDEA